MHIRNFIALMVAAILLPMIVASAFAVNQIRLDAKARSFASLHKTVDAISLTVDIDIQSSISALMALGNSETLQTGQLEAFYAQAKAVNRSEHSWVALLRADGTQVLNTAVPFNSPPTASTPSALVNKALSTNKAFVSDIFVGPRTGRELIAVYVPTSAVGPFRYVLAQGFSPAHWKEIGKLQDIPNDWIVEVIDSVGNLIASNQKSYGNIGRPATPNLVTAAGAKDQGLIQHTTVEGTELYVAFDHSKLTGWTIAVSTPTSWIDVPIMDSIQFVIVGFILATLASGVLATTFGRRFVSAVQDASAAAGDLGRGDSPKIAAKTSIAELDGLNQSLIDAGVLLENEHMARQKSEVERERLLVAEHRAFEISQQENTAKDRFLAMLGHELRNPLAAISGAVVLLEQGGDIRHNSKNSLNIISRQNRHLVHIIDDLLDLSRLKAGKIVLSVQPINLAHCLLHCIENLKAARRLNNHNIHVATEEVWINADSVRIEQIFINLIGNSLKFSPNGSNINIDLKLADRQAVVAVQDYGAGMSSQLLTQVFEPFVQGPSPVIGGLGIGLSLVKQLVELHQGTITVSSAGLNLGSLFVCHFPTVTAPVYMATQALEQNVPKKLRTLLYVEDSEDVRTVMADILRLSGYNVIEATNGADAISKAAQHQPDAIVLDIGLPDINGYEVARQLRLRPVSRDIPIIALTGFGQASDERNAAQISFDAYLIKPIDADELIRTVEAILENSAS